MNAEVDNKYSRFLMVTLGERHFGLALDSIREAIALPEITPLPSSPRFFLGVIFLRGSVIPIIDMAAKMGIKELYQGDSFDKGIVICQVNSQYYGILVHAIDSVTSILLKDISEVSNLTNENTSYISGIYKSEQGLTLLIEPLLVVEKSDLSALAEKAKLSA